jgi:hypothetical protein
MPAEPAACLGRYPAHCWYAVTARFVQCTRCFSWRSFDEDRHLLPLRQRQQLPWVSGALYTVSDGDDTEGTRQGCTEEHGEF